MSIFLYIFYLEYNLPFLIHLTYLQVNPFQSLPNHTKTIEEMFLSEYLIDDCPLSMKKGIEEAGCYILDNGHPEIFNRDGVLTGENSRVEQL